VRAILHPSDFSPASEVAFHHALKFALVGKLPLAMLHVSPDPQSDEARFPKVRETLIRWGVLPGDCDKDAVANLGIEVEKIVHKHRNPVRAVTKYLAKHRIGLIVLASHPNKPGVRLLHRSVAELIARAARVWTLFLPDGVDGFVSAAEGTLSLRRVLIPLSHNLAPQVAVDAAARAVRNLKCADVVFTLLHVGRRLPSVGIDLAAGETWDKVIAPGNVVDTIIDTAAKTKADLIVMTTDCGTDILDTLRGTTTEQVMRRAARPVLAVPVFE
jgi:nucleotide-binding universal stress UspA family protein